MPELAHYQTLWNLTEPTILEETATATVFKVRSKNRALVLKILTPGGQYSEAQGALALQHFAGLSAVGLINHDRGAHLLEFVDGPHLKNTVIIGNDGQATGILCDVLASIHSRSHPLPPGLVSMRENFRALFQINGQGDDVLYMKAREIAQQLLHTEQEQIVLHGDIHYKNILRCSKRGWLAIDPKGVIGERTYDFSNIFYNPDDMPALVESRYRILSLAALLSRRFEIDPKRILSFAFVYGCLSASWAIEDGLNPTRRLRIAKLIHDVMVR